MSWVDVLVTVVGAFGGLELFKWLFTRKSNVRLAETDADKSEFEKYQQQIEFNLERISAKDKIIAEKDAQLVDKENKYHQLAEKYHDQTLVLRETNAKLLKKEEECGNLKAKNSELLAERKMKLCERKGCAQRQPQSGY